MKNLKNSMSYVTTRLLIAALTIAAPAGVSAQEPLHIGFAAEIERDVEGQIGAADFVPIAIDDDIFFNEVITTEPDSQAVMSFRDGSYIEIGPNSALTIDEFIFNPVEGVKTQTVTALVGTFRFVSGMAMPNQTITINTPTATLGIRGSVSNFAVAADGTTGVVPTNGAVVIANRNAPNVGITLAPGNTGVIPQGRPPVAGPMMSSVGRQLMSRVQGTFGPRRQIPPPAPQRRARDAAANTMPAGQQQAIAQQQSANAPAATVQGTVVAARGDQSMEALGIDSVTQLDAVGALEADYQGGDANIDGVVNNLNASTETLQATLDTSVQTDAAASQAAHEAGTTAVITGLSLSGDASAVTAATNNAAQADASQAAPAVSAAAANLPNQDASAMTDVLQGAIDGLQTGGTEVTGEIAGSLTATAINNMDAQTQQNIGSEVASNVAGSFAAQYQTEAADLAASLTAGLGITNTGIADSATQVIVAAAPGQAQAINTAASNAAAANQLAALQTTAAGGNAVIPPLLANALTDTTAGSSGPAVTEAAAATDTPLIPVQDADLGSDDPETIIPEARTTHNF